MATAKLSEMVGRLGRRLPDAPDPATDADLLGRFVAGRDEAAFAELVRRHGPMVFGVCRRVTGHHHLAEDAFQAAFVVLATRAAAVAPRSAVAAWLYGVAYRTALRARTMSDRRRRREAALPPPDCGADPADPAAAADLAAVLDEEVARLPDGLRLPVVLCELEGRPRRAAARELGIPEGTLSSRLAAARKALAARLRNRGVALTAAGLSAALGRVSSAAVPAGLAGRAVAVAVSPGIVPAPVAVLSSGVIRIMFVQKLKLAAPLLGLIAAGVFACGLLAADAPTVPQPPVADPPKAAQPARQAPVPAAKKPAAGPNKLLFYRAGHLTLIDPDGTNEKQVSKDRGPFHPGDARLSPDGKRVAVLIQHIRYGNPGPKRSLHVRGIDEKEPGTDLGVECQMFFWSTDGTEIVYSDFEDGTDKPPEAVHGIVNVATKAKTPLKLPANHIVTDWSRDGKLFLTTSIDGPVTAERFPAAKLHLLKRDGTEHKALTDGKPPAVFGRLSPDGTRVLFIQMTVKEETPAERKVRQELGRAADRPTLAMAVLDVATGKVSLVEGVPLNAELQGYCWSPDGKKIAYAWRVKHEGDPKELQEKETESHLIVCDPDGKNAKTIATEKGKGQWVVTIGHIDWR